MIKAKLLYWASTLALSLIYPAAAAFYLTDLAEVQKGFIAFGYPGYLVPLLISFCSQNAARKVPSPNVPALPFLVGAAPRPVP